MTLKKTYKLGIAQNLEGFYPFIPQLLIPILLGSYALGIYSGGYKIYSILLLFYLTLFYGLAPYLVKLNNYPAKERRKYHLAIFFIIVIASGFIGLTLYFFGESIVLLILGKSFGESVLVFKAVSITLVLIAPVNMLLGNILIFAGYDKYYLYSMVVSSIVILILSPIFIKYFNVVGAVYAMAASMFTGIIVSSFFYLKIEKGD